MLEKSFTIAELAKATGIPKTSLYNEVNAGSLAAFTLPGNSAKRVWASEWERFQREQLGKATEPSAPTVASLAAAKGEQPRDDYDLADAAQPIGVRWDELRDEAKAKRLRTVTRKGEKRVTAEELDSWLAWSRA